MTAWRFVIVCASRRVSSPLEASPHDRRCRSARQRPVGQDGRRRRRRTGRRRPAAPAASPNRSSKLDAVEHGRRRPGSSNERRLFTGAAPGDVVVFARRAPDDVVDLTAGAPDDVVGFHRCRPCPRRCCRARLRRRSVPQTMLSQSAPPHAVPHTMLSHSPSPQAVPHTMLSHFVAVGRAPHDVVALAVEGAPHDVVGVQLATCPRRCCRTRSVPQRRAPHDVVAFGVCARRPTPCSAPRRCPPA